jgi:hypothetical protein
MSEVPTAAQDEPQTKDPLKGQLTFTEEEIRKIEDFYNYAFSLFTEKGCNGYAARNHLEKFHPMAEHIKKCRNYIFDPSKSVALSKDGKVMTMQG